MFPFILSSRQAKLPTMLTRQNSCGLGCEEWLGRRIGQLQVCLFLCFQLGIGYTGVFIWEEVLNCTLRVCIFFGVNVTPQ